MPLIKSSKRIVWSTLTIDKSMPFGKICSGNCRKLHEDLTKVCNKCREYMFIYKLKNRDVNQFDHITPAIPFITLNTL